MHATLKIATKAAKLAGQIILRHHNQLERLTIDNKAPHDFVSEVDRMAEDVIIAEIKKYFPQHTIVGEETGTSIGDNNKWIIDPLDGTTNYLHGIPHYSVSIAFLENNVIQQAVVYDPFKDELFSATKGSGVFLNEQRLRVSKTKNLDNAILGTGFPFKEPQNLDCYLNIFKNLQPQISDMRRTGSAALDLAYLAAGRYDGFWEIGLQIYDIAAGVLLITEAGGFVSDFSGGKQYLETGNIIAGNAFVFPKLLTIIQPHLTPELSK